MTSGQFTTGSVLKYATMPRILPRVSNLFLSGFGQVAYLMAQVYRGVRLLPENHPYLYAANIGKFNIRQVVAAAAMNLSYKRENIDQILVFFALLMGFILLIAQSFLLLSSLLIPVAQAGMILSFGTYFGTPDYGGIGPAQDLAFIVLDRVFGVPGIFESCVSTGVPCNGTLPDLTFNTTNTIYAPPASEFPWPYHLGLHAMLQFYSVGLLVVATFIILYFVVVIVAETAQTGTPFGKRFNSVWAPLRLVMALGLLIPITNGLNSAQYITLYMAKFGSNFASNGWHWFNRGMVSWGAPQAIQLVAKPQNPEVDGLLQFMMLAHACKALEEGYIVAPRPVSAGSGATGCTGIDIADDGIAGMNPATDPPENYVDGYLVRFDLTGSNDARRLATTDWQAARTFFDNGDMTVRFGDRSCENTKELGRVAPTCGEIVIPIVNPSIATSEVGSTALQAAYYETVRYLWGEYGDNAALARRWRTMEFCDKDFANPRFLDAGSVMGDLELRRKSIAYVQKALCIEGDSIRNYPGEPVANYTIAAGDLQPLPDKNWNLNAIQHYKEGEGATVTAYPAFVQGNPNYIGNTQYLSPFNTVVNIGGVSIPMNMIAENAIREAVRAQIERIANGDYELPTDVLARGWAGAGMWYNQIARINGGLTAAAWNYPVASRYPQIMEDVMAELRQNNQNMTTLDQFNPNLGGKSSISLQRTNETRSGEVLNTIYKAWGDSRSVTKPASGNALIDMINWLFGTKGLFSLSDPQNAQANPLALLSSLGKSLVETSIRNIGIGMLAGLGGAAAAKFPAGEQVADAVSGFMFTIAMATLSAGITLYYILPFLPFVYFFFALGNWVKGIFEAMVGVPLWALAHIRIDGNGLPGEATMNGYHMLFEIFLRPILVLFGMLASVSIFAAMATVLNGIWPIATKNVGGTNYDLQASAGWIESARGPIDQLFYTVMYAVVLYIIGLSSFKLIDLIPNQIMRWMGTGVSTFADSSDGAGQLMGTTQQVTSQATGTAMNAMKGGMAAGKAGVKGIANMGSN